MMVRRRIKPSIVLLSLLGLAGSILWMPLPSRGLTASPALMAQSAELAEAERLDRRVIELYKQGKYREAMPLAERALAIVEKALGPEHPTVADSLDNLAELYLEQLKYIAELYWVQVIYDKADLLYRRSLSIREKAFGPDHPTVADSLDNLAGFYLKPSNYFDEAYFAKADLLYRRSLSIREKAFGPNHPTVADSLDNLAGLYLKHFKYAEAEPLYQRSLSIREKAFGPNHPTVADSLDNLAELYSGQGNYTEAEHLYRRSLVIREKVFGSDHPTVADSLDKLAKLYSRQGNYQAEESLYQRSLSIREKAFGPDHLAVAGNLDKLAKLYSRQGNYAAAEPLLQRSLVIREKAFGPNHPAVANILTDLAWLYLEQVRSLGRVYVKEGKHLEVASLVRQSLAIPLLQRSLVIREKAFGSNHPAVAVSLDHLAELYWIQGNYTEVELLYRHALAIREKAFGPEHPAVADSLDNLSWVNSTQGKYAEAEPFSQRALAIREKAFGLDHVSVANSLTGLGWLYWMQGKYAEAEPFWQRSLSILEKGYDPDSPALADRILNNLGGLYWAQGNYAEAETLLRRSLTLREKAFGLETPHVARSLNNLAELYGEQGNYTEAKTLWQRSLTLREKLYGPEHPNVADSLNGLAGLYLKQGNYTEAETLWQRSLNIFDIWEKAFGLDHPDLAVIFTDSLNGLAGLYLKQGNYAEVETLLRRSLSIREKALGSNHPDITGSLNGLAELYLEQGNYTEAETLWQRSLAIREKAFGPDHRYVAVSLNGLAELYQDQRDITRALEFRKRGTDIEERNLSLMLAFGSERRKRDYMSTISGTTHTTISLHLQSAPDNPQAIRLAFTTLLRRKGRILDALTQSQQALRQNITPEDRKLFDELAATHTQIANLTFSPPPNLPPQQSRNQLDILTAKAERLEDTLSRRSAEFRTESQPVTLEALQPLISQDAALVELVQYRPFNPKATQPTDKWDQPRYAAYVLFSQGEPQWTDLGDAGPIDQALEDLRFALQDIQMPIPQLKQTSRILDSKLMQPIRQLLGNTRSVLLSPDGALNLIPFEALVDENDRYLVENYRFTYLTSGRDLLKLQYSSPSQQPPLVVADPSFNRPGEPVALQTNTRTINLAQKVFAPLPGTAKEAKAIAPLLGVEPLLGAQATEQAIKQDKRPQILHVATHGFFETPRRTQPDENTLPDNPLLYSGLVLAGVKAKASGTGEDGILTALEVSNLNLIGTKLVVLSACDTGLGNITAGEGIYGLRRALVIAGAESQVISLWKVDDEATKDLMVAYYKRLKADEGRSEALRQTQLEMLRGEQSQHPYFWASFIPSGDWTPIELTTSSVIQSD